MGRAIPCLLVVVFLADIGARFLPVDPLTFRAWEALSRYRPPGAPFEPNRYYVHPQSYGDSAAMGNLPALRQYRHETFTTDAHGFRNTAAAMPVAGILAGDSFAVGSGVGDEETLSVALSRRLGCRVYNAGGMDPDPDRLRALAGELGLTQGLVVHAYTEDVDAPTVPNGRKRALNQAIVAEAAFVDRAIGLVRGFVLVSPLRILSERVFKHVANDRILPNAYAASVLQGTLGNGDPMLFIASRVARVEGQRPVSAAYWSWMQAELKRAQLDLVVVLIPSKYTVYRALLVDRPAPGDGGTRFLDRLEDALHAAGVPVINLTALLTAEARRRAARHQYLYWRDDIHWNSEGIQLGATAILGNPALAAVDCAQRRAGEASPRDAVESPVGSASPGQRFLATHD